MRELIEHRDFCGVTYQRSVFVDQDGCVISIEDWKPTTTDWQPVTNCYNVGGVCGFNSSNIIR